MWRGCVVPFNVDNSAFQRSAVKSWSRAEHLAVQIRRLFMLQLDFGCVREINWISTADNFFADALSWQDGHRKIFGFSQFRYSSLEARRATASWDGSTDS
eukprot:5414103-Pleurochrysis_carterae.AAC.1